MLVGALIVDSVPVFLIDCDQAFRFSPEMFTQRDSDVEALPYRETALVGFLFLLFFARKRNKSTGTLVTALERTDFNALRFVLRTEGNVSAREGKCL
jgi:hypothetical protein